MRIFVLSAKKISMSLETLGACLRYVPCSAGDVVAGDSANVSRSCRIAVDCFRAELKREFYYIVRCCENHNSGTG